MPKWHIWGWHILPPRTSMMLDQTVISQSSSTQDHRGTPSTDKYSFLLGKLVFEDSGPQPFLAPETSFVEGNFFTDQGDRWFGGDDSDGSVGKKSACNVSRPGFNPWVGKILWRRAWQPTPVFLPEESHGQRSLVGYTPWRLRVRHD